MLTDEYQRMYINQQTHWWYVTKRRFIGTFLRLICLPLPLHILDVGCGTGANVNVLQQFGLVSGVDQSKKAKQYYTQHKKLKFTLGQAERLPFSNNSFDLVTSFDVLYHKNIRSPLRALTETSRVLKPHGYCLISDCVAPYVFGPHDIQNQARERFTKQKLSRLMIKAGFRIVRSSYIFMFSFPAFLIIRLLEKITYKETDSTALNNLMIHMGSFEDKLLQRVSLPIGSSVIILAQKT